MSAIYSVGVIAAEEQSLPNRVPGAPRSIIPFSDQKLQKDLKAVATIDEHQLILNDITYGGGYGGNEQTGMLAYDGMPYHLAPLVIRRDDKKKRCFLENKNAGVYHYNFFGSLKLVSYGCPLANKYHNDVYWNESLDKRNGGYSTDNDALYASMMVNRMYEDWFGISVSQKADGSPLPIKIATHESGCLAYAYVDKNLIVLGDGDKTRYPLTSPGVVAFTMSYFFTEQHSNLDYDHPQSGAISIAFGAMADQAVKFYLNGKNDWQIGSEVSKTGQPFYYMDQPSKDCGTHSAGDDCSIDHMSQYKEKMKGYYSSGIYRRAFYLLATTPGWDVKKAFSVMVQANRFYWASKQDFSKGVCGIIKAARDLQYNESAVIDAFNEVGVSSQNCQIS